MDISYNTYRKYQPGREWIYFNAMFPLLIGKKVNLKSYGIVKITHYDENKLMFRLNNKNDITFESFLILYQPLNNNNHE